ncbi:hypothetical protein SADUNF_Sadunf04G0147800 [Salix dunnii]|uniref:Metallothionein-like protein n=1 Tax=Salix dunnii TaxID=1413687 RepID=A0A835K7R9_9ROSI|nr:hypothetical protein SADUNF_Sadunf04G0147800 [Salix dunnii]
MSWRATCNVMKRNEEVGWLALHEKETSCSEDLNAASLFGFCFHIWRRIRLHVAVMRQGMHELGKPHRFNSHHNVLSDNAYRCSSMKATSGEGAAGHNKCSCGEHCGCNPCTCPRSVVTTGVGKVYCKCGAGCACPTCSS